MSTVIHAFEPVCDSSSKVLILGTMPSPKSRENGFYYGHPQNRFWPVLAAIFAEAVPETPAERRRFALEHRIALWDVLRRCDIDGASDASIRDPVPNDLRPILAQADIRAIFANGGKAAELYDRFCLPAAGRGCIRLFSTSPANCRRSFSELVNNYRVILDYLR